MAGEFLLPQHQALIDASRIAPEVAAARGYRSVTTKAALAELGFGEKQLRVPALVIPLYNAHGEVAGHQARPDRPRCHSDGKAVKYEMPRGMTMLLDVPPPIREKLRDPQVPLFLTEGVRKADAAVSAGLCCAARRRGSSMPRG